ncbi:DUF1049 domain-containing protein [Nocardia puris]|uniref:Uncharacterized protein DUF1049 n=1 Tax=Nocardia puris TaxID=208602 RepID=A0A366CYK0_9NOCA|nr:lipopolysaccharide assembly protein LapA domain-containing protein [Nocardia puris]MBF6215246.1 DUF1049 domain-containing protein [Nocardia puris]MBF6369704.1 DUF1049 domain-containing protein [Nocardia puris]MBF6463416.1 DUF1049 domain-containing protein [Nocardia puris]RBO82920.1 uncharacterized protein DUF1049 [Nocardia puris]
MSTTESRSFLSRISPTQWAALAITVLAIVFVIENRTKVTIEFLLISVQSPMWLILLAMFAVGWLAGVLTMRKRR